MAVLLVQTDSDGNLAMLTKLGDVLFGASLLIFVLEGLVLALVVPLFML